VDLSRRLLVHLVCSNLVDGVEEGSKSFGCISFEVLDLVMSSSFAGCFYMSRFVAFFSGQRVSAILNFMAMSVRSGILGSRVVT
jgi:hypothetical protein